MRVLWCITGGQHFLAESVGVLEGLGDVTVVFSRAGEEVARMYGLFDRIINSSKEIVFEAEQGACSPLITKLRSYDKVVVAPCTANTAAKIVCGIADTLVTNIVSQAIKSKVEVVVLPTDYGGEVKAIGLSGGEFTIRCRDVDRENAKRLGGEVKAVYSMDELKGAVV